MDTINSLFLFSGFLIALSIVASRVSSRIGVPLLVLFLVLGMLAGEEGVLGIEFDDYSLAYLIGHLALAMILLDGGLRTRLKTFRVGLKPALSLATLGVFVTSGLVGLCAMWVFDLSLVEGLLVGAIVGSTDAAAVFSMLAGQGVTLNERVGATLEIESGTNDPMAIFLTITLAEILVGSVGGVWQTLMMFASQFGLGLVFGVGGGWLAAKLLRWLDLAPGLYSLLALALGFLIFGVTSVAGGSGFLAIYLAGLMIGNQPGRHLTHILPVHDGLAWLSQIGLFLVLGMLVTPSEMIDYAVPGAVLALGLIFVARPLAVLISLKPFFSFRWREIGFISWVGLRGAVPIVLAIFPVIAGVENATLYFNVAFFVVLISLLMQGASLARVARLMRVEVPAGATPNRRGPLGVLPENDYEMFVYKVENEALEDVPIRLLRFPSGALISGLFRQHAMLHAKGSTRLKLNDVICVIGRSDDLPALNRLFNGDATLKRERAFFGTFTLDGEAMMSDVADAYGLTLSPGERDMTLGEFVALRVGGHPVVGDDVDWHGFHWVVNAVQGNRVTRVGLRLYH
ncbi:MULTISPECIES: potassium/proton antiporter [Chromohalobacter]|uniref:Potassium/proton antiporter, CPA1 family n=1 Tax=Chromohalobacter israelensis (strain ATCC BAA-138 / DSM 3043 / CIP 106854 / NCIMB 13768 / 1H11) TaxID=290398 RepID=Q1QW76_CHRI1|nr:MULTISPECIES: potassium/proton antiporter [Chromohalobacter]ABE59282.1 potassium/proton antiporter, CPA1 family [Chromohalobacter salexigens DSM 3043]MBZ5876951.1 potassium/proton antiporter [Chromohalobacter salexigens]MDF9434371.1 potassium/proton antiporter [Chromohalobacter israelensis]MDO0946574.1 potassium/proton antiporter [Chromohalobacter salexigens]NQY46749.1 potassium/proton antiporter [Chromohalobacter sp.]